MWPRQGREAAGGHAPHNGGTVPIASRRFSLPAPRTTTLALFDLQGRRVATLASGRLGAGTREAVWDGREAGGKEAASGVYLVRLAQGSATVTRKIVLAR